MGDIIVGFCLDYSGSMDYPDTVEQTCKGFNKFKEEQASQPGNAYMTLSVFDTSSKVRYSGTDMKLIDNLGTKTNPYNPSGGTALYDAVDDTITEVENWLHSNTTFKGQVLVVILTDGGENSSRRVQLKALNDRIADKKENHGWEFIFMGSGGAAWTEGANLKTDATLAYAGNANTYAAYTTMTSSVSASRATGQTVSQTMPAYVAQNADALGMTQSNDPITFDFVKPSEEEDDA